MTNKLKKTCKPCVVTSSVDRRAFGCNHLERMAHALDFVLRDSHSEASPIEEQLKQCPEAFKAGELLERALNSLKYGQDEMYASRTLAASGRRDQPSHRLIGLPLDTTIPHIKNVPWHYCTRTDEQLAAQLGQSLLRLARM